MITEPFRKEVYARLRLVGGWVKGDQRSWFGGDGVGGWIWRLEPVSKREEIWEEEEEKGV